MAEYSVFHHIHNLQEQAFEADEEYKSIYDTMYQHICRTLPDIIKEDPFRTACVVGFTKVFPSGTYLTNGKILYLLQRFARQYADHAHVKVTLFNRSKKNLEFDLHDMQIQIQLLPQVSMEVY